jgi:hypothetical protein
MRSLLTLLVLGLFAQDPATGELLQRLEDDRAETREKAQKDLVALGEAAIPALRELIDSVKSSGELKLRAAAVVREIELAAKAARAYRDPKRVTLKVEDRTLREVLEEVARQAEVKIEAAGIDVTARVTLDVTDAPLFEVLDLLSRDQADRTWEPQEDGSVRFSRDRHVGCPAAYGGPFRIRVHSINTQRNNDFKARTVILTLSLQADWDRRYKPSKVVEIELGKVQDDQGSALEITPVDVNIFNGRAVPGAQLRIGVGLVQDAGESGRVFVIRGLAPAATTVSFEGTARFSFPLDQREIKFEKPAVTESRELGDSTVRLMRVGMPENWSLSFHKSPTSTTPGWARTIAQRFDADSFVVVDQDGAEFPATMRTQNRGRFASDETVVSYQAFVQRNAGKALKEVRFRFVDQTLVKTMPFKFTALALP